MGGRIPLSKTLIQGWQTLCCKDTSINQIKSAEIEQCPISIAQKINMNFIEYFLCFDITYCPIS